MLVTSVTGTGRRCPICGQPHTTCGPTGTGTPVDLPTNTRKGQAMARERGAPERRWVNYNGSWRLFRLSPDDPRYEQSVEYKTDAEDGGRPDPILTGADVRDGKSVKDKQKELDELEAAAAQRREDAERDRIEGGDDSGVAANKARTTGGRTARRTSTSSGTDGDSR